MFGQHPTAAASMSLKENFCLGYHLHPAQTGDRTRGETQPLSPTFTTLLYSAVVVSATVCSVPWWPMGIRGNAREHPAPQHADEHTK
jgi:hypothetical protein